MIPSDKSEHAKQVYDDLMNQISKLCEAARKKLELRGEER